MKHNVNNFYFWLWLISKNTIDIQALTASIQFHTTELFCFTWLKFDSQRLNWWYCIKSRQDEFFSFFLVNHSPTVINSGQVSNIKISHNKSLWDTLCSACVRAYTECVQGKPWKRVWVEELIHPQQSKIIKSFHMPVLFEH